VLQCVAACCSALQCVSQFVEQDNVNIEINTSIARVAVCCSVLQCVSVCCNVCHISCSKTKQVFAMNTSISRVAVCCSVLQRVLVRCSVCHISWSRTK